MENGIFISLREILVNGNGDILELKMNISSIFFKGKQMADIFTPPRHEYACRY